MDKRSARKWAKALAPASPEESALVVNELRRWWAHEPATGVLVYLSMPGELALEALAETPPHTFFTTRTPPQGALTVHPFDAPRERHRYGFEQPRGDAEEADLEGIGIVLVPGLAFDGLGGRLGRGKGYYDRLLATLPGRSFVGVSLERFLLPEVPMEPHDLSMTHLATERGVRRVTPPPD
ncbi:MAG: 5-formyltetrahydrofolate cyclo-ligase [Deltaproteobacteria bacterium]|nr:5-formyltetrahydrofolate cyclo-ligase [Deltaproteobacteria bacterium]